MTKREAWQLTAQAAEIYEQCVARYILGPWAPLLAEAARLVPGERVLDVACGTGVVARIAAERVGPGGQVVAIDLNPGMIAVARSRPASFGAQLEYFERNAIHLQFEKASFDVVLCQQGLQFIPDMALAMREMHRVLREHGRVALSVWNNVGPYNFAVGQALAELMGDDIADRFLASRRVPSRDDLERFATASGFSEVMVRVDRIDIHLPCLDEFVIQHLTATPVAPEIMAAGPAIREMLGARVVKLLARFADGANVCYPEETHVLTAQTC